MVKILLLSCLLLNCNNNNSYVTVRISDEFTPEQTAEIMYAVEGWKGRVAVSNNPLDLPIVICNDMYGYAGYYSSYSGICLRTINSPCPLYVAAAHEMGHALGLDHDNTKVTIMQPWCDDLDMSKVPTKKDIENADSLH